MHIPRSPDGGRLLALKTLLDRISPDARAPMAVSAALVLAIAVDVSRVLVEWQGALPKPPPALPSPPSVRRERAGEDVRHIATAHLFGTVQANAADAPESNAALVLAGTIVMGNPARGYAFIAESGGSSKLYAVGAPVSGGAVLEQVYRDHVVLNRQASLEKLSMPRAVAVGSRPALAANAGGSATPPAAAETVDASPMTQTAAATDPYPPGNKPWE